MACILIIEGDRAVRTFLRAVLESRGHEVLEAGDGEEGLALFRQRGADAVICDLQLPRRSGWHVIRELRYLSNRLGIVATIADWTLLPRQGEPLPGADLFLAKPFTWGRLLEAVGLVLDMVREWDTAPCA
jgi:two-component system nitrogen regulation response regulator NtrX